MAQLLILFSCSWTRLAGPVPNRQQAGGKNTGSGRRKFGPFSLLAMALSASLSSVLTRKLPGDFLVSSVLPVSCPGWGSFSFLLILG